MTKKEHKVICADENGITIYFLDTQKHKNCAYLNPYSYSSYKNFRLRLSKIKAYMDSSSGYKGKRYQQSKFQKLSPAQNRIVRDAVHGLNAYDPDQLYCMTHKEKLEISKLHYNAKKILNPWKQEIINNLVDDFFASWLPNRNHIRKAFQGTKVAVGSDLFYQFSLDDLKISDLDIANKLIEKGVLPRTFIDQLTIAA